MNNCDFLKGLNRPSLLSILQALNLGCQTSKWYIIYILFKSQASLTNYYKYFILFCFLHTNFLIDKVNQSGSRSTIDDKKDSLQIKEILQQRNNKGYNNSMIGWNYSTLSCLAKILHLIKWLIIWVR